VILADFLPPKRDRSWDYARQSGVEHVIARCHPRDIGLLCYNFMATIGWCPTDTHVVTRGGALTNRFQLSALSTASLEAVLDAFKQIPVSDGSGNENTLSQGGGPDRSSTAVYPVYMEHGRSPAS